MMSSFMNKDLYLDNAISKHLYHDYASNMPIIDYHCHLSPQDIYEDKPFENITQIILNEDHYKWRQMRSNGIEEYYITGNASDKDKFMKWIDTLEMAIGNPLYVWSHLELQRYFELNEYVCRDNAESIWNICNKKIIEEKLSPRKLIVKSNVRLICTTDDPIDKLEWHKKILEDNSFHVKVLPAWRPDKIISIEKKEYLDYLSTLQKVTCIKINNFNTLKQALESRMDFFEKMGCKVSDHGLNYFVYEEYDEEEINQIFLKKINGKVITEKEVDKYKTALLIYFAEQYVKKNWVMQIHYGVKRDNNKKLFLTIGSDAGADCISDRTSTEKMVSFFDNLTSNNILPKTILYSINPEDNAMIDSIIGCFQDSTSVGKLQHGSAWWFNDHKKGIEDHLTSVANLGLLGNFIGMLTDSRSFLSYVRHEYFRRILCNLIGNWVEKGEFPNDEKLLKNIIEGITYNNAMRYFEFDI